MGVSPSKVHILERPNLSPCVVASLPNGNIIGNSRTVDELRNKEDFIFVPNTLDVNDANMTLIRPNFHEDQNYVYFSDPYINQQLSKKNKFGLPRRASTQIVIHHIPSRFSSTSGSNNY